MPATKAKTETTSEEDDWGFNKDDMPPAWSPSEKGWDVPAADANRDLITISLKGGSGTQAWMVLHANGVDEAINVLEDPNWEQLVELVARRGAELQEAHGGSSKPAGFAQKPSGGSGWGNKQSSGGSQNRSSSKGQVIWNRDTRNWECKHGEAVHKTGTNDNGSFEGWVCPSTDREEQCRAKWKN